MMNYPIEVLRREKDRHQQRVSLLESMDHEMNSSILFANEEITNHKDCIKQIEVAIEKLL